MERCKAQASSEAGEGREHYNRGCASLRRTRAAHGRGGRRACDAICASFLFEYSTTRAELLQTAVNLFGSASRGRPCA